MSKELGWAAMNLEMPPRVPRTEYSVTGHYALISRVTGIPVTFDSPANVREQAVRAFCRAWDFSFQWATPVSGSIFGDMRTSMGHAVYADGGTDWNDKISSPFKDPEEVLAFDPESALPKPDKAAIIDFLEKDYARRAAGDTDTVHMTGIYVTCVSAMIDLFGWDLLLMAAGLDPKGFGALIGRYAKWVQVYFDAMAASNVPVIMIHDDICWTSGAVFNPEFYRTFIFPHYKNYMRPLREAGKKIMYTSDGDYTMFLDDIAAAGAGGFVMEPMTDMAYFAKKYGKTHVFIGNADTRILLYGSRDDIEREVRRCMDIGKGCPGYFMAVGNHIPANTPIDACLWYNECYEKLAKR